MNVASQGENGLVTRVVSPPDGISEAVQVLRNGGLLGLPTETVYGLGGPALDPLACARIFEAKDRPLSDPLIVHIPEIAWLKRLASAGPLALRLAEEFWPGPLTLVVPRRPVVPDIVTSGQETVAIRMSGHPVFQEVAKEFGEPIAAPSANRFGRISPTTAEHVMKELSGRIPLVVDGGICSHGIESTIVLVKDEGMGILRHGPITTEQLAEYGPLCETTPNVAAPGRLKSHYAPRTPLTLVPAADLDKVATKDSKGLLAWSHSGVGFGVVEHLSRGQDMREAAANLYAAMRRLDDAGMERIIAEELPATGLGMAVMERLTKAAAEACVGTSTD